SRHTRDRARARAAGAPGDHDSAAHRDRGQCGDRACDGGVAARAPAHRGRPAARAQRPGRAQSHPARGFRARRPAARRDRRRVVSARVAHPFGLPADPLAPDGRGRVVVPGGRAGRRRGVALDLALDPPSSRVGEPIAITVTVSGAGNVALWPEPAIRWPRGFRAYPGETGMRITPRDGRIAGTKVFHYLVMPDSAGSFLLPEVRYPYYDLTAGDYRVATMAPRALAVAPGIEAHAARPPPPPARGPAPA